MDSLNVEFNLKDQNFKKVCVFSFQSIFQKSIGNVFLFFFQFWELLFLALSNFFCSIFGFSCFLNGICLFEFLGVCVIFVDLTEFLVYSLYGVFWVLTSYNFLKNCWAHCFISYYSAILFHLGLLLIILLKFWVPCSILDSWVFLGYV